ncbi:glycoside hydrolase family 3 C-terminal domain-containing protein [Altererythrobacter sp. Root672]|uniref:glycoside hydrolase family 3 C-terminal domain-containing protein n=1 Tax=Altererythrobacter sp. Root672 TaxID=1736584 RepID=UPI0006FAA86D|nr:glycoside hydrolase family 3 C-terminal domain-containing protein [Altererythrobacter sp. Root672]KRA80786.1 beta-glucosidase [Altererythrobacter sp. Root672]
MSRANVWKMTAALSLGLSAQALMAQQTATPVVLAAATKGTPAERAAATLAQMTQDEKLTLLKGYFGTDFPPAKFEAPKAARNGSAGYVPGIPRLGIPPQWQADAGIGVATQGGAAEKRPRTALPSGLATAASWDPELAFAAGKMIGSEARADGFNVLLGGSVNLMREPRNGRNFEYTGEDPLLAGIMAGAQIAGVQSNQIISTVKHFAVNDQETDRNNGNAIVEEGALRMSDLLAFQIAIERGDPGSVMCAYNRVGGLYACEQPFLLTQVLRDEWGFPGYVMSDWGAAHSTAAAANAGLDQESGYGLQRADWFSADKLGKAVAAGEISQAQIDLMVTRILHPIYAHGLIDNPVSEGQPIDFTANRAVSQRGAEAGMVLLKNEREVLPLAATARRIAVIGGHADKGVLSGGGSSQVYPDGTNAVPGIKPTSWPGPVVFYPSSPLEELRKLLPDAQIDYAEGTADPAAAARLAAQADVVLVFGTQWASESIDVPLALGDGQDALIGAVAAANPNTVVVLQTGGPVLMPWADKVPAIVEAWYPGRAGGAAIARILTGAVNPSGHLPATFPRSLDQLPHPGDPRKGDIVYDEGAAVGYKWFDKHGHEPLFPFGHGLSYTTFEIDHLVVMPEGEGLVAMVEVTNTGKRAGAEVVQVYVSGMGWEAPRRLGGFERVELAPGETKQLDIHIDPRVLATWFTGRPGWTHGAGAYTISVGHSSRELGDSVSIELPPSFLPPAWRPAKPAP